MVEYLLDTEGDEMTFEVARCRPLLTEDFFTYLKDQIGASTRCQRHDATGESCAEGRGCTVRSPVAGMVLALMCRTPWSGRRQQAPSRH